MCKCFYMVVAFRGESVGELRKRRYREGGAGQKRFLVIFEIGEREIFLLIGNYDILKPGIC